ncbi:MAG: H-type lectin domain-containing protein, partial [Pseudomonadota bacterium]
MNPMRLVMRRSVARMMAPALAAMLSLSAVCDRARAANPWSLEAGEATTAPGSFQTVSFATAFATAPIVVVLPTTENGDPTALRIRNVTASGFDVAAVEPSGNDGVVTTMTFQYVAMTPGVHQLPTGEVVVAAAHTTSTVQRAGNVGGPQGWDVVAYGATLAAGAAVTATIQTMNSETGTPPGSPSIPWLTVAMRNAGATSVELALERAEAAPGSVLAETIGYIAFPGGFAGSFFDDGDVSTLWSAVVTPDNIRGFGNGCFTNDYSAVSFAAPHIVASQARRDGNNGGWARRCSLSGTAIGLTIDEDQFANAERNHTTEAANILAFSRAFHATFEGLLAASKTVSI